MAIASSLSLSSSPSHSLPTTLNHYSNKFGLNLVSNEALLVASAAEAVALARAAAQAAREAVIVSETNNYDLLVKRRKKRRLKLNLEVLDDEEEIVTSLSNKFTYLSLREEANCCLTLKEGAKIEEARVRMRMIGSEEHEPSSRELAIAMGMSKKKVEKILCRRRESQERITRSYRRLVASVAVGYQGRGLSFQDLIQEGSIGLLRGAQKFVPQKGYKLSTYAYWWIKQAIIRAIENKSRIVRLPGHICGIAAKIAEANNVLSRRLQRCPTCDEIAQSLDLNVSTVEIVLERSRSPISLNRAISSRGHMTLQEIITRKEDMTPERIVKKDLLKRDIEELLKMVLSERESRVLRLRFGLGEDVPHSCEEIGKLLKLSRERVRQIYNIAMAKLQGTSVVNSLRLYIDP